MATALQLDAVSIESHPTGSIPEAQCLPIVDRIRDTYLWFSPESTDEDILGRLRKNADTCTDLLIDADGTCIGFSAYHLKQVGGMRIMFRGGTVVRNRSLGLYKKILGHSIPASDADFVVAMTQNPRVYETLRSFSPRGIIYPTSSFEVPGPVREIASACCPVPVDLGTLIFVGIYDDIRKEDEFKSARSSEVARLFRDFLGENDGFFVVVPLK